MRRSFGKDAVVALTLASALLGAPAAAKPGSVRGLAAQELPLATIAYRIAAANSGSCAGVEMITGLVLHDLTRYEASVRPAVSRAFSMDSGFGVLAVVPNSVAARAGLRVDDEILAVGRFSVADPAAWKRPRSYERMERFHAIVNAALVKGEADVLLRRSGNMLRLPIRAQRGCGGKLALRDSSTLNAWSDGRNILVTTGMAELSRTDDEMSFVIAHEMAHNILGHSQDGAARGIFGFAKTKRGEIEADRYAVRLMSKAGYEPEGGISFLQNARRRLWWSFSLDHPGFGRRMKTVAAAKRATQPRALAPRDLLATAVGDQKRLGPVAGVSEKRRDYAPPTFASLAWQIGRQEKDCKL